MSKKLIVLAIINSFVYADQYIYGKLVAGVENKQFQNTSIPITYGVIDYGSYFGIHGIEAITPQANFIWQIEQFLDITLAKAYSNSVANGMLIPYDSLIAGKTATGVNQLASSDSYIGIQSTWGMLRLGNLSSYLRSYMGAIDIFNYNSGYGANGLSIWSRTSANVVLPYSFMYNSSSWHGFTIGVDYTWDNLNNFGANTTVHKSYLGGNSQNGDYQSGIASYGIAWQNGDFKINFASQLWNVVGVYPQTPPIAIAYNIPSNSSYSYAYVHRFEMSYNDPGGLYTAAGVQITDGLGWSGWANSGGAFNNYIVNQGYNYAGLSQAEYQTQEFALSAGYHVGQWMPKIAYSYGNNLMYGGSLGEVIQGTANQIANSGYQQIVAELDYTLTPRTLLFVNYGQIWYGATLQNISYCGINCNGGNPRANVNQVNQAFANQVSFAIGMSHVL
ncbi:MAG: hypothetical protein K2P99_03190 [Burkholderiales bacterium]|nr:hypothetical protein [Burkholderiales bacterium]